MPPPSHHNLGPARLADPLQLGGHGHPADHDGVDPDHTYAPDHDAGDAHDAHDEQPDSDEAYDPYYLGGARTAK